MSITIESKTFGGNGSHAESDLMLDRGDHVVSLRSLVDAAVRLEVAAERERGRRRTISQELSASEIEAGEVAGKIAFGQKHAAVDEEDAVARAVRAFARKAYFVFVDDEQVESLDTAVHLRSNSRVTFLHVPRLVGG